MLVAYGVLIPEELLDAALWLNVHPSLLPRWRGAAPVERALLAGDEETGVSIIKLVKELDAGPIAAQRAFPDRPGRRRGRGLRPRRRARGRAARRRGSATSRRSSRRRASRRTPRRSLRPTASSTSRDPEDALRRIRALSPHIGARAELTGAR